MQERHEFNSSLACIVRAYHREKEHKVQWLRIQLGLQSSCNLFSLSAFKLLGLARWIREHRCSLYKPGDLSLIPGTKLTP